MHAMKSISEAGHDTPRGSDPSRTNSVPERVRQRSKSGPAGVPGAADFSSVAFLRSGWLLLTALGVVSLFYAAILIYHVSTPPAEARSQSFMEQARQLCIRYRLVSTLNPDPAIRNETESHREVVSMGVSENRIPDDLPSGK